MFIFSYKFGSQSAKALAEATGYKRIKHKNSKFKGGARKKVVNWGASSLPEEVGKCVVLNNPICVALASDKLKAFNAFKGYNEALPEGEVSINIPDFTTDKAVAQGWLNDGAIVVERHKLTGNSGDGIVITEEGEVGDAKLYTKYVPKKQEYRVHVFNGQPIDHQRKARVKDIPDDQINWKVRNMAGGFIFARNEEHVFPPLVSHQAILAVKALGLDFGAVDIIYNEKEGKAYVLEVNTAPGLSGTTLEKYVEAFNG